MEAVQNESIAALFIALDDNAGKSVSMRQISLKILDTIEMIAGLDRTVEVPNPLREVQVEHRQTLWVRISRNRLKQSRGVFTVTIRASQDGSNSAIMALSVDDVVIKCLKLQTKRRLWTGRTILQHCLSWRLEKNVTTGKLKVFKCA